MSVDDLLPDPVRFGDEPGQLFAGTVLDTPALATDEVRVRLNVDRQQFVGPMTFMPRGAVLPTAGDPALVAFDDEGRPWLVAWREG